MYSIIVHGGVGAVPPTSKRLSSPGVREAVLAGSDVPAGSGSSMDAVETAMKVLEDNPLFNAGTGSVLTFDGEVEMDAAVAHGPALGFGAIAGIRNIEHPISLAHMVMDKTDHVLLQDTGAQEFACRWASRLTIPLSRKGTPSGASTASASRLVTPATGRSSRPS